jgi:hypothetical protein
MIALLFGLSAFCLITTYIVTEFLGFLPDLGLGFLGGVLQQGLFWSVALFILWCFAEE